MTQGGTCFVAQLGILLRDVAGQEVGGAAQHHHHLAFGVDMGIFVEGGVVDTIAAEDHRCVGIAAPRHAGTAEIASQHIDLLHVVVVDVAVEGKVLYHVAFRLEILGPFTSVGLHAVALQRVGHILGSIQEGGAAAQTTFILSRRKLVDMTHQRVDGYLLSHTASRRQKRHQGHQTEYFLYFHNDKILLIQIQISALVQHTSILNARQR